MTPAMGMCTVPWGEATDGIKKDQDPARGTLTSEDTQKCGATNGDREIEREGTLDTMVSSKPRQNCNFQ